jgi:DNA segregation ATPase FtsK/SpoIIIE, S-DNA-T family
MVVLGSSLPHPVNDLRIFPGLFGQPGEWLRRRWFDSLGLSVFILLAGWLIVTIQLARRKPALQLVKETVGWFCLLLASTIMADRINLDWAASSVHGNGGSIGAWFNLAIYDVSGSFGIFASLVLLLSTWLILSVEPLVIRSSHLTRHGIHHLGRGLQHAALKQHKIGQKLLLPGTPTAVVLPTKPITTVATNSQTPLPRPVRGDLIKLAAVSSKTGESTLSQEPLKISRPIYTPVAARSAIPISVEIPSPDLLDEPTPPPVEDLESKLREMATLLEKTFKDFGLTVRVVEIHTGPVITQYEIALETGLRVTRVVALSDDLALNLSVPSVRIVAPIPGKNTVGIELPNEHRAVVRMKELLQTGAEKVSKAKLPLMLGKDAEGRPLIYDLAEMPHLLIAGRTGTGKSVCLNSIIVSLLLTKRPDECKMILVDPKKVELSEYGRLPHLMHPVVTENGKAEAILAWAVDKMEERYELLRKTRVRNISSYNELSYQEILNRYKPQDEHEQLLIPEKMSYIVIVVDEVGDLMMDKKKEVEGHIIRLAQKSRAAGIHLILTTQRPTVDVITGLIKSNLPARICFQVADRSNSRVVLDEMGAEKLLGKGDMLFLQPSTSTIVRAQGTYVSDAEILRVVGQLEVDDPAYDSELLNLENRKKDEDGAATTTDAPRKRDALYEQAVEVVIREGRGSVSLLQRALGIGYGRGARLIDFMAEDGIVGEYNGAQAREVLYTPEQWADRKLSQGFEAETFAENS